MDTFLDVLKISLLVPTVGGAVYGILCLWATRRFFKPPLHPVASFAPWPAVTILKPVCGLEKNLKANLRTACLQDYPEFQVVFSVEDPNDPALPCLEEMRRDFPEKVSLAVGGRRAGPNGKINNLLGALRHARHELLVISDSDAHLSADYLQRIIAPLSDPEVGFVCTLYRATAAERWFEKMELLALNADFIPGVIFAYVSGAAKFCLGASVALRRSSLREIGGLEALADYLAEDYELGRRLWNSGKRLVLVPCFVDLTVDLAGVSQWWSHQVAWDQKTRAAQPLGFLATVLTRSVPCALLLAVVRGDALGMIVLSAAVAVRLSTAAWILRKGLADREGLKSLALLPLRDLAGFVSWGLAWMKKTVTWRGRRLVLSRGGRLAREVLR